MSRILPGEHAHRRKSPDYGQHVNTWPPQTYARSIVRFGSRFYIRDNSAFPNVLCIFGIGPKTMREINRQLSNKEHMIIAWNADDSLKAVACDRLSLFLDSCPDLDYGVSAYTRDCIHPDLPGVIMIETIRRVRRMPPARGPIILFSPGKFNMMHAISMSGPTWLITIRTAIESFFPTELINTILDFVPVAGFDDWLLSQAPEQI